MMHAFACRESVHLMRRRRLLLALTAFAFLCLPAVAPAWAAPPANDARDNATVIGTLPFSGTVDTTEATIGLEDDVAAANCGLASPYPKSVWYRYTPASDHDVLIDTAGSNYPVGVGVGTGNSCVATFASAGGFSAQAGQTYFIAVVDIGAGAGGSLELSVDVNHAPVCNDVAVSVQAGTSAEVPFPDCSDADDDFFDVFIEDEPARGVFDYNTGLYTPTAGFSGEDSMTFRAIDSWGAESELGVIRITVTPAPQPSTPSQPPPVAQPAADATAPSLELVAPSSLTLRTALRDGVRFTTTTNEAGRVVVRVFVDRATARRLKIKKNATGPVVVGSLARDIAAGETVVKVKLSGKARTRMRLATRVKLRIVAKITDSAGNIRTQAFRITLKGKLPD
jgi:hypothetical protein